MEWRLGLIWLLSPIPVFAQTTPPSHIDILAASCAACHGTNGNSIGGTPVLAGLDRDHFITQMEAFRTKERPSTVMYHHAKGLTPEEITQLADFFAHQPRIQSQTPQPQHMEKNHER